MRTLDQHQKSSIRTKQYTTGYSSEALRIVQTMIWITIMKLDSYGVKKMYYFRYSEGN